MLIAAIIASDCRSDAEPDETTLELLPDLQQMIEVSMGDADIAPKEFPYLLQAAAALYGLSFWGRELEGLASGGFFGACPNCKAGCFFEIESVGCFAFAGDDIDSASAFRVPIAPASEAAMPPTGVWLYRKAIEHSQEETANGIAYIFGTTRCPTCEIDISVLEAIERQHGIVRWT
jgi:hypothetical protein